MKSARVTLLTTPEGKPFPSAEAVRSRIGVAERVRSRCERRPDDETALLAAPSAELRKAVDDAGASLRSGLAEADALLAELRAQRSAVATGDTPKRRRAAAGRYSSLPMRRTACVSAAASRSQ